MDIFFANSDHFCECIEKSGENDDQRYKGGRIEHRLHSELKTTVGSINAADPVASSGQINRRPN